ncbi:GntR family transcriptional regulator [Ampullimonas aquatilis]|uniref:GntR family transcriptional regulator n=1 Tax=Ampullimonas aquatilis TaxID=1341549 RepID=UPI003C736F0E
MNSSSFITSRRRNSDLVARTQASIITDALRQDIIAGVFPPDSKLKLRELSERYAVGTIPLREALSRLAMSGFVDVEDQRGFRVAGISEAELSDITNVRQRLEADALRDSIKHGDVNWETELMSANHRLSRIPMLLKEPVEILNPEWEKAHCALHDALLAGSTSNWLQKLSALLREQTSRYRQLSLRAEKSNFRDVTKEHQQIVDAALKRDAEKACLLLHDHFATTTRLALDNAKLYNHNVID